MDRGDYESDSEDINEDVTIEDTTAGEATPSEISKFYFPQKRCSINIGLNDFPIHGTPIHRIFF